MKHLIVNSFQEDEVMETELFQFRRFLRNRLDQNERRDPRHKRKFEVWLDFLLICQTLFKLSQSEEDIKFAKMIVIGNLYLGKPPFGFNMAVGSQCNRKDLESHCYLLQKQFPSLKPNTNLVKECYEYIYMKLHQKYEIFRLSL